MNQVKLFTSLSAAEADQAEHGTLRGDFVWVEHPEPEAGAEHLVWVSIEMPDNRLAKFERRPDRQRARREFLLPARVTNLHQAQRVELPL